MRITTGGGVELAYNDITQARNRGRSRAKGRACMQECWSLVVYEVPRATSIHSRLRLRILAAAPRARPSTPTTTPPRAIRHTLDHRTEDPLVHREGVAIDAKRAVRVALSPIAYIEQHTCTRFTAQTVSGTPYASVRTAVKPARGLRHTGWRHAPRHCEGTVWPLHPSRGNDQPGMRPLRGV